MELIFGDGGAGGLHALPGPGGRKMPGEQGKTVAHGLILRETETKETDKILTVLTAEMGKIPVIARGARRKNSRLAAACQLFAWSEMTLYKRGNWYYMDAADPAELFAGLQKDLVRFSLAAYLAELTEFVAGEENPVPELLRLLLNGLYALASLGKDPALVKPAFTFRLLALAGFEPMIDGCAVCGADQAREPVLDVVQGVVHCRKCGGPGGENFPLSAACMTALEHILHGPDRKLYNFALGPEDLKLLDRAAEGFAAAQLERSFRTLGYYKAILM